MGNSIKKAVITGITGQDGAYLAKLLLGKGYSVTGAYRRSSSPNFWRLKYLGIAENPRLDLVEHDVCDQGSTFSLIESAAPDEVYNLAAQSFVATSFNQPSYTASVTGLGALNILEAIRSINKNIKYYQASTSEMFGKVQSIPQVETTPFYPRSPYGVAKLFAHWITVNYRESYGIYSCSGILFNHESPLRGEEFVTRKIAVAAARIGRGQQDCLYLGNLDAKRDWGHAEEYVEGMWAMLQVAKPEDYVLATGNCTAVRDFARIAFGVAGLEIAFRGHGVDEVGVDVRTGREVIRIERRYFRPAEVDLLIGDSSKARNAFGWVPKKSVEEIIKEMVESELIRVDSVR
jgi:GDPmannose 4,6-dehydratase